MRRRRWDSAEQTAIDKSSKMKYILCERKSMGNRLRFYWRCSCFFFSRALWKKSSQTNFPIIVTGPIKLPSAYRGLLVDFCCVATNIHQVCEQADTLAELTTKTVINDDERQCEWPTTTTINVWGLSTQQRATARKQPVIKFEYYKQNHKFSEEALKNTQH